MNLYSYCLNILEPTLSMLIDIYKQGGVHYIDIQRIGASMCEIEECIIGGVQTEDIDLLNEIYDKFDIELESLSYKERLNKVRNYEKN